MELVMGRTPVNLQDFRRRVLALAAFMAVPSVAWAAPMTYDCDTAPDHFSALSQPFEGKAFVVTGKITFAAAYKGKYLPTATVRIGNADGSQRLTLSLTNRSRHQKDLQAFLILTNGQVQRTDLGPIDGAAEIAFKLAVSTSEKATLELGGTTYSMAFNVPQKVDLAVSCSTGQFTFRDLVFEAQ